MTWVSHKTVCTEILVYLHDVPGHDNLNCRSGVRCLPSQGKHCSPIKLSIKGNISGKTTA